MRELKKYIKARNEAMLDYPNTEKLDALFRSNPKCFSPQFKMLWAIATPQTKVRTLEKMIEQWIDAPGWLVEKVKQAEKERGDLI